MYLSDFFEKNRASYYDALSRVRESNDLIHWIKFFLNAVIVTASKGKETFNDIFKLKNIVDNKIITLNRRAPNAQKLMILLYRKPVVNCNDVEKCLNISKTSANKLIKVFVEQEILKELTGNIRYRYFIFKDYFNLFI